MRYTKHEIAVRINRLARLREKIHKLEVQANDCTMAILKVGGGASSRWRADLVRMPKRTMVVKAHSQVRLYPVRRAGRSEEG